MSNREPCRGFIKMLRWIYKYSKKTLFVDRYNMIHTNTEKTYETIEINTLLQIETRPCLAPLHHFSSLARQLNQLLATMHVA